MSGGAYDHLYSRVNDLADQIENDADSIQGEWSSHPGRPRYSPATIENMKILANILRVVSNSTYECEWMASGDTGEDQFNQKFAEDLSKLKVITGGTDVIEIKRVIKKCVEEALERI